MLSCSAVALLVVLGLLASQGHTQAGMAHFKTPGPQVHPGDYSYAVNFQYGQPQTFRWTTNLTAIRLQLVQETVFIKDYDGLYQEDLDLNNFAGYFEWSGIPSPWQNLDQGNVFFLLLFDAAQAPDSAYRVATSNYINITDIPTSSSSSIADSAPTSTSTSTSSASTSASANTKPRPNNNDALPIGLGVGLGLAILLALLAAGLFYRRQKKWRNNGGSPGWSQDLRAGKEPHCGAYSPYQHEETTTQYSDSFGRQSSSQHKSELAQPSPQQPQEMWGRNIEPLRTELQ